eukprot:CAMPEP_0178421128 /NCGR_PEP_ID=MMETSP0689_2-20121128/26489_1 /TAXON_ID=160604 /ORGANISM="Amphidinium massartii, Strain CS-259" /LENGTH=89 /DNA_ID=CAMNT_0020042633 /DNA_START=505 /DNA_END=774 /DNA_ORIENTATION=-
MLKMQKRSMNGFSNLIPSLTIALAINSSNHEEQAPMMSATNSLTSAKTPATTTNSSQNGLLVLTASPGKLRSYRSLIPRGSHWGSIRAV